MESNEYTAVSELNNAEQTWITQENQPPKLEMKWYKFLIYFSLFSGALFNLIDGIVYTAGLGDNLPAVIAEEYYFLPDNFKAIEVIFGLLTLAMAAWGIYTRFQLSNFKKNAPNCYYIFDITSTVISTAYSILGMVLTTDDGMFAIIGAIIIRVVSEVVFILCNVTYFRKRKHLFVN